MRTIVLITLLCLAGCAGRGGTPPATPASDIPQQGNWFCQPGFEPGQWDCVQNPALARDPPPARPVPTAPAAPPAIGEPTAEPDPFADGDPSPDAPVAAAPAPGQPASPASGSPAAAGSQDVDALPADHYTIQAAAVMRRADLAPLLARDDLGDAFVAEVENDGTLYHALLLGVFESATAARAAMERLPDDVRAMEPWIRPVRSLQRAAERARRLADSAAP